MQGYAFCEYLDPNVTDIVINELNLRSIDRRTLTVKRACVPPDPAQPAQVQAPSSSQQPRQAQSSAADPEALPTQAMLQAQHSVTQGLPQSQPSMQSMTQGVHQAELSMQSMTLGMPQHQHSMQSMTQGGPPYQHSMQSMTQGLPQMSYAASPQGMQQPPVRAGIPR